jgi:two-component system CheB/CheR fusion protein
VLITSDYECLFFMGPTERYLQVAHGYPTHDLIALTSAHLHTKLRAAVQRAVHDKTRALVTGARCATKETTTFSIAVEPVQHAGENLLLVCFIDEPKVGDETGQPAKPADERHLADLERELDTTRVELQEATRKIAVMNDEQKAINEEALSVNEEQQSTNEELLISKEELQSLNEELTVLNSQLQETLERQRTTSNDLQNILYSTDVATLFLDTKFNIRFFTPATKSLFNMIASDIGRPLNDLQSLAADKGLTADARTVLQGLLPVEREVETLRGVWFTRRILPYRTEDNKVEGVIITFTDITERKSADKAIEAAKRQAELANIAKSRFLAAASHDLRQPLQTLSLLQGMLETSVEGERSQKLVARLDQTLGAMTGILNTLLDINQIEAGTVRAEFSDFPINELFERLRGEFAYHAQAKHLELRVVPCSLLLHSDVHLLEQMLRNLLTNALKYTKHGKVLLGVRRRSGKVSVEIWDSGIGIPASELDAIFNEYHQLDNAAREREKGLGLGLSIVQRLAKLLDHDVRVSSKLGKGSAFSIEIDVPAGQTETRHQKTAVSSSVTAVKRARTAKVLIIEDDPEIRELLDLALSEEGHIVTTAPDGIAALEMMARGNLAPDLVLADYNLPRGMNGVELTLEIRARLRRPVPVIILTGDISTKALADIATHDCTQINKPVKLPELRGAIDHLLSLPRPVKLPKVENKAHDLTLPTIHVVDDDAAICEALRGVLEEAGWAVNTYASAESFLASYEHGRVACLLIDAYLPGLSGLELLKTLNERGQSLPSIMITGRSDVPTAVQAMQAGALNFIEKPVSRTELIASVGQALEQARDTFHTDEQREDAIKHVASLTPRQHEIMTLVLAGHPSKNIAADLGISQRTAENHRACIMKKMGAKSLPALARRAMAAIANSQPKG